MRGACVRGGERGGGCYVGVASGLLEFSDPGSRPAGWGHNNKCGHPRAPLCRLRCPAGPTSLARCYVLISRSRGRAAGAARCAAAGRAARSTVLAAWLRRGKPHRRGCTRLRGKVRLTAHPCDAHHCRCDLPGRVRAPRAIRICVATASRAPCSCTGCRQVHYCGKDCQAQGWADHKPSCEAAWAAAWQAAEESVAAAAAESADAAARLKRCAACYDTPSRGRYKCCTRLPGHFESKAGACRCGRHMRALE